MDASNQYALLLCALQHFGIPVTNSDGTAVEVAGGYKIRTLAAKEVYALQLGEKTEQQFSDVVRLCSYLQQQVSAASGHDETG